ncbi:MAG: hypothetical protein RL641_943 [Candidatus Parcubacteria bacterium]|jgi:hypothetical protein
METHRFYVALPTLHINPIYPQHANWGSYPYNYKEAQIKGNNIEKVTAAAREKFIDNRSAQFNEISLHVLPPGKMESLMSNFPKTMILIEKKEILREIDV